jgi:hypothetical protein
MTYDDWKAPKADSQMLIWPEPEALLRAVNENGDRLAEAEQLVQNRPLRDLREEARSFAGVHDQRRIILTGHQTELWHPGVWAKNALIDAASRKLGGLAVHLAVDTDAPKHLALRWPNFSMPITDDAASTTAEWAALVAPPTPAHLDEIEQKLNAAKSSFGYEPMLNDWMQAIRLAVLDGLNGSDLPKAIATSSHHLDWSLGLEYTIQTLSPTLGSRAWLAFAYHVMARAGEFAEVYNASLACYRKQEGIDSTTRPMPDLRVSNLQIEAPFWLDETTLFRRHRMMIERRDGGLFLCEPFTDDCLQLDPSRDGFEAAERLREFVLRHRLRITPRALTLTIFMRLFVTDLFVHGIGGGRYDQIADRIIQRHFGIEPPKFAVTTATMFLPQALERERACVPCVLQQGHQLKHAVLGERKMELVAAIAGAPRKSRERAELFTQLQRELRANRETSEPLQRWKPLLEEARTRAIEDSVVFDREVFYAVQPRERLMGMIQRYRTAFGN